MDVFDLYAKISLDSKGYEKGLDKAKTNFDGFKTHVGDALKAVAKITAAAVTAGATATGKVVKDAVSNYGEYEQLVGGIDSLFLESSQKVQDYAKKAFSSAQISENEYMRLVTSFSGAIIKSSGNREKAAELSNTAIQDMADQANKYGKTVEEVSQTYTSLARGNFQTLDNLFGGMFAGTKTGLREMLTTAEKYRASLGKTVKYSETSYADIVSAIHDVSEMMGVSGTSAKEAGTTIQGSMASVKAAWQDVLTAMGSGKDISKKLDNLTQTVSTWGNNMKPVISQALSGVATVVGELVPQIANELPKLVVEVAPTLLKAGADIVSNLAKGIFNELQKSNFDENAKVLTGKVNEMIKKLDTDKGGKELANVVNKIISAAFNIVSTFDGAEAAEQITTFFNSAIGELDIDKLGQTVSNAWVGVWEFIGTALNEIDWENVGAKISEFINSIDWSGILDSMFKVIGGVIKAAPNLLKGVIENLDFESAANAMAVLFAPKAATKIFDFFKTNSATKKTLEDAGGEAGGKVSGGMLSKFSGAAEGIVGKIGSGLKVAGVLTAAFQIGWAIGTQIKKGLDDIGWGKWIDDKVNSFMSVVTAAENAKATDTDIKADAQNQLAKFKKAGIKYLTENDVISGSAAYRKASTAIGFANKYGGTASQYIYDASLYEKAKAGKLQSAQYVGGVAGSASGMPSQYSIYLDTGALVGGTSSAKGQQYSYTKRGVTS